jgi:dienelactone hydrolase
MIEPMVISSAGRRLQGLLEGPREPRAGVVLVHGWGGCRIGPHRILVAAARRLAEDGLAALRFDLTGRGESEGDPMTVDLDTMIADVQAAVRALRERLPGGAPVAVLGMCSGGNVGLGAAALMGDADATVCWSTYPYQEQRAGSSDLRRTGHFLKVYARRLLRLSTWKKLLRGRVHLGGVKKTLVGHYEKGEDSERNRQTARQDILGPLSRYERPVLFLFGSNDPEAVDARAAFADFFRRAGRTVQMQSIEGANHNFYSLKWKREVIEATAQWLRENLPAA